MSAEDDTVYDVQWQALEGTPLGDMMDRSTLIAETREVATRCPLLVGEVQVVEGSVRMTKFDGVARAAIGQIVYAPRTMPRYTGVHELAHIVHRRSNLGGRSHGPEWRGVYVDMLRIVYGEVYGDLMREAFYLSLIPADDIRLAAASAPLIDIDALTAVTQKVRWLG